MRQGSRAVLLLVFVFAEGAASLDRYLTGFVPWVKFAQHFIADINSYIRFCNMRVITVVILGFAATVHGHGTVVSPRSRNSVDYLVGVNTPKVMT